MIRISHFKAFIMNHFYRLNVLLSNMADNFKVEKGPCMVFLYRFSKSMNLRVDVTLTNNGSLIKGIASIKYIQVKH